MAAIRAFLAALTLRYVPKMHSGRVSPEPDRHLPQRAGELA